MLRKYDFWLKDARTFTDENGLGGTWWRGACLILGGLVWGAGDPLYDPPLHLLGVCLSSGEGAGCGRTRAQSQDQEAEWGFPSVEKPDPLF